MELMHLMQGTLEAFRPPKRSKVSEWADANRILVSESSSEPGPWRTDRAPYQREIMDCYVEPGIWRIVVKSSAQVGKTDMALNMIGETIDEEPCPILFVQPTVDEIKDFSKRRITPMIDACPVLSQKVYEAKSRDSSNTILLKTFPGGSIAFVGANSPSGLSGKPIRILLMDEVDQYPASAGSQGNPIRIAEQRTATFQNRKIVITGTPTNKGASKICDEYDRGTQEEWHIACPHCEEYHFIYFDNIKFVYKKHTRDGETTYDVEEVTWECPSCGAHSEQYEVQRTSGKWIARNPSALKKGVRSFHLNAFVSPWAKWETLVQEFLESKDNPEDLRVFYNTKLGQPWERRDRSGKPEQLYNRREHYNAEVPTGALILTMGVDTQDNRLEYEVVGWGRGGESWAISFGTIMGRADAPGVWEELDELLAREWKLINGKALKISTAFMDSGGHHTQAVYNGCEAREHRHVYAIKGDHGMGIPYVRLSKKSSPILFLINADSGKEAIMYETGLVEAGPRYMHFPLEHERGYNEEYFKGLFSERIIFKTVRGRKMPTWEKIYDRNEALDCRNYARAAFSFFNWDFDAVEKRLANDDAMKKPPKKKTTGYVSRGIQVE